MWSPGSWRAACALWRYWRVREETAERAPPQPAPRLRFQALHFLHCLTFLPAGPLRRILPRLLPSLNFLQVDTPQSSPHVALCAPGLLWQLRCDFPVRPATTPSHSGLCSYALLSLHRIPFRWWPGVPPACELPEGKLHCTSSAITISLALTKRPST